MPTLIPCYHFNSAIVRLPSASVVHGLRADNCGDPDYKGIQADHQAYPATLEILARNGYSLLTVKTSEIEKIDAGLSSMSLRWLSL